MIFPTSVFRPRIDYIRPPANQFNESITLSGTSALDSIRQLVIDKSASLTTDNTIVNSKLTDLIAAATLSAIAIQTIVTNTEFNSSGLYSITSGMSVVYALALSYSLSQSITALQATATTSEISSSLNLATANTIVNSSLSSISALLTLSNVALIELSRVLSINSSLSLATTDSINFINDLIIETNLSLSSLGGILFSLGNNFSSTYGMGVISNISTSYSLVVEKLLAINSLVTDGYQRQLILEITILFNSISTILATLANNYNLEFGLNINSLISNSYGLILEYNLLLSKNAGFTTTSNNDVAAQLASNVVALCQNISQLQANSQITLNAENMIAGLGGKNYFDNLLIFFTSSLSSLAESGIIELGNQFEILVLAVDLLSEDYSVIPTIDEYMILQLIEYYEVIRFGTITD